jgi:pyochelin biosynthetic protein PchC
MAQFQIPFAAANATGRLAVFHHAGGSSMSFVKLARALTGPLEVCLSEMPGRATRHGEPVVHSIAELSRAYAKALAKDSKPLQLYGHSLGGLVAFETALALEDLGVEVERLVVSCVRPPSALHGPENLRALPSNQWTDPLLLKELESYGGLPDALRSGPGREYFLPLFRHDFRLVQDYQPTRIQVNSPFFALAGSRDEAVPAAEVEGWRAHAANSFTFRTVPGGHFFVLEDPDFLPGIFGR